MTAEVLFTGGQVWLGPGRRSTALAVGAGRILAIGPEAESMEAVETIDLGGGMLLPAFSDGHCHPPQAGLEKQGPIISHLQSVDDIVAEVGRYAAANPDQEWIIGGSYDPALAPLGSFQAAWLDAVVSDRPVMLRAHDYHTAWVNSKALALAGLTADTPDPQAGVIDRHPDRSPSGTLREPDAYGYVDAVIPPRGPEDLARAVRSACADQAAVGVTWMQDAWVEEGGHLPYLTVLAAGDLTVRTNLALLAKPDQWRDQLDGFLAQRAEVEAAGSPELLSAHSIKFFADGVIESGTAEMLEPYLDSHHHGMPVWDPHELAAAVTAIDALGFQTHIHAIGDAAVRHALDAIEEATRTNQPWDRRPVITHVQLAEKEDLARFAALDVTAAMQTFWAQRDALMEALTAPRLGAERADRQYQVATMKALGARVSIASDWPVSTNSPLEALTVAATRQTVEGLPVGGWVPQERLELEEGILAATSGGAYQAFSEAYRGSIAPGMIADLVWVDTDLTAVPALDVRQAVVLGTWLEGRRTHQ